jgi:hypothetical protein
VFQQFRQAKFAYGGSVLSLSQFSLLSQLPQKMKLASKVVKSDWKIIILHYKFQENFIFENKLAFSNMLQLFF